MSAPKVFFFYNIDGLSLPITYKWNRFFCHLSIFPPPHSLLPPIPALVTIFFVLLPNQSFSFRLELISPSLIVDAILQSAPTTSSSPILLPLLLFFSSSIAFSIYPALHSTATHYKWDFFALSSYLVTSAELEQCLDWMWLALLSILGCRIGAMHKILCWQAAVYYHHSTDIQHCEDRLPISQDGSVEVY